MEENNRQRASDNANEPHEEIDLTAVTASDEDNQRRLARTNTKIDVTLSRPTHNVIGLDILQMILPSNHNENSTVLNRPANSTNLPSGSGKVNPMTSVTDINTMCTPIGDETKSLDQKSIEFDGKINKNEPECQPIRANEPVIKQGFNLISSNINEKLMSSLDLVSASVPLSENENKLNHDVANQEKIKLLPEEVPLDKLKTNIIETLAIVTPPFEVNLPIVGMTADESEGKPQGGDLQDDEVMIVDTNPGPVHKFDGQIQDIAGAWEEFQSNSGECFTKGCKWSPDGTCLLTNSNDNVLRIFDLPTQLHCQESWNNKEMTLAEMKPVLKMPEGGLIYDYCWYPLMSSWDPLSCCLLSSAQDNPIHLWDAFTGQLRATYRAYNQVDEVEAAHSVAFDLTGDKLYCGFKNVVRVFNTAIPGRKCETRCLKDVESQRGIVSCIAVNPASANIYAVGTYFKSVGLYCEPNGYSMCLMSGHGGGVTHLAFSPDGTKLFSGARKDNEIICWDIRNLGHVLYTLERKVQTNQRVLFDVTPDGRYLVSGNSDGAATVWDLLATPVSVATGCDPLLPHKQMFTAHNDCVNGVSVHQQYPILATSSGQRHFAEPSRDSSDSEADSPLLKRKYIQRENCIKLWWTGKLTATL